MVCRIPPLQLPEWIYPLCHSLLALKLIVTWVCYIIIIAVFSGKHQLISVAFHPCLLPFAEVPNCVSNRVSKQLQVIVTVVVTFPYGICNVSSLLK